MTRRRFYAPSSAFASEGSIVTLAHDEVRHLRDVLRLKRGDEVFVFDGEGREYRCTVNECGRDYAKLNVDVEVPPARPESPLQLTLATGLLKGEKFDLVVQKATELGVVRIVPVSTHRADVRVRDALDESRRTMRWQRIALEAAKQSGRARVPEISAPLSFESLIESVSPDEEQLHFMFAERSSLCLVETITRLRVPPRAIIALTGPEGGWSDLEIAQACDAGWKIVTLGGRTLRAETAAIVINALLQHLFGDLR